MLTKLKQFFLTNEQKIVLGIGLALVGVVSFEIGLIKGQKMEQQPIIIESKAQSTPDSSVPVQASSPGAQNSLSEAKSASNSINAPAVNLRLCRKQKFQ